MSDDTSTPAAPTGAFAHLPDVATLTPEQAQREIGEAMAGRHLPGYYDAGDPGHAAAVARVDALQARLHAGDGAGQDAPPDELGPPLAAHEASDKINNFLEAPTGSPDGDEVREGLAHAAGELGLNAAELGTVIMRINAATKAGIAITAEDAGAVLRREWGDRYAANLAAANRALDRIERSRPGARAFLEAGGLLNDPTTISVLARAGGRLGTRSW